MTARCGSREPFGAAGLVNGALNALCTACVQQEAGSAFLANLNAGGDTVAGVSYTVIESRNDEVVTPYTSAFLSGPGSPTSRCRTSAAWTRATTWRSRPTRPRWPTC